MNHEGINGDHVIVVLIAVTGQVSLVMMLRRREMRMQDRVVVSRARGLVRSSLMEMRVRRGPPSDHEAQRRQRRPDRPPHHRLILGGRRDAVKPLQSRCYSHRRRSMPRRQIMSTIKACIVSLLALSAVIPVIAHEVTHQGTVVTLQTSTYAQPTGGFREAQELEVTVVDPKTKKPSAMVFTLTPKTRLLRDGKPVTVATAAIQKAESVQVVVDHDVPGNLAIEIRLPARK